MGQPNSQQREQQFIEQLKKIPVSDRAQFLAEARAIVAKAKAQQ